MKRLLVPVLVLSLASNALLLWHTARRPSAPASAAAVSPAPTPAFRAPAAAATAEQPVAWSQLPTGDYAGLAARLKAAGFPTSVVRPLVIQLIGADFRERKRQLAPVRAPVEYWQSAFDQFYYQPGLDPAAQAASRALEREERRVMRAALGSDYYDDGSPEAVANRRRQFGDLPSEKVDRLRKIFADYEEVFSQIMGDTISDTADGRAKRALLDTEKRADIERVLTRDELFEFDLRNSPTAQGVRSTLGPFAATEAEFRALYAAAKALEPLWPSRDRPLSPEFYQQAEAVRAQRDQRFEQVLGPKRYDEFKRATDSAFRLISDIATDNGLPSTAVEQVLDIQRASNRQLEALRDSRDLSENQRQAQLAAVEKATLARIGGVLGPTGLETYRRKLAEETARLEAGGEILDKP